MVSQRLIRELQKIIKEDYGLDLSMRDVSQIASSLVGYFDLLAKIDHREWGNKSL